jgi:hypothetical protein
MWRSTNARDSREKELIDPVRVPLVTYVENVVHSAVVFLVGQRASRKKYKRSDP